MRNLISLFKVQFLAFNGLNGSGKKRKQANTLGMMLLTVLLMAAAFAFFGYTYAKMFGLSLSHVDGANRLLPVMLSLSVFVNFFFSFYSATNSLFGFKDYELLASLPVKTRDVVFAKFVNMYVADLFFTAAIMIPSIVVSADFGEPCNAAFVLKYVLIILFSPGFAIAASVMVGVILSAISSLFRRKNLVNIILLLLFILAVLGGSFVSGFNSAGDSGASTAMIEKIYFFVPWLVKAKNDFAYAVYFALVNLGCFVVIYAAITLSYKKLNAIFTAKKKVKNFKLKNYEGKSVRSALFRKEMSRIFSCPVYAVNCIMGLVISVIMGVVLIVVCITSGAEFGFSDGFGDYIAAFAPAALAFTYLLAPTTACSVSLEGQSFWIITTSPVEMKTLFNVKLLANAVFYVPGAIIVSVPVAILIKTSFAVGALCVLSAVLLAFLGGSLGLVFNLLFPKLKWDNETQVVKQSLPVFLTMICAFAVCALFAVEAVFLPVSPVWKLFIADAVMFVANILLYALIAEKGEKLIMKKL